MNDTVSTRTICCKVALDSAADTALRATQAAFNQAATYCATVAWEQQITNKNKLHHLVYAQSRLTYGLGSQLACCARDKAAEAVRALRAAPERRDHATDQSIPKTCPTFRDDSSIRYDVRTYRLMRLDQVSLYALSGRVIGQLELGDFQRRTLYDRSWKIGGAELLRRGPVWYLHITQTKADPAPDEPTGYLGVDLGIVNLATDSDGTTYTGDQVERTRERYAGRRRALQPIKTKSAKRHLKRLSRKQHRFQKDTNHLISKRLVATAKRAGRGIALEDLTGIRARVKVRGAGQRARHSNWAFLQLRQFVTYKAQRVGVRVVAVDSRHTSQRCSACGHTERANRRSQAQFCCVVCGHASLADYNAAINIEWAAVNQPMVSNPTPRRLG
ncbi:MAG: RNA-guided endonuclease InsQ/TnpB family protein [Roseiflexaceae bacterium]